MSCRKEGKVDIEGGASHIEAVADDEKLKIGKHLSSHCSLFLLVYNDNHYCLILNIVVWIISETPVDGNEVIDNVDDSRNEVTEGAGPAMNVIQWFGEVERLM